MNVEYHKWWSNHLGQEMELKVYGHSGKPMIVFPTQGGRFYEFEDFGMVAACEDFIEQGKVQLFTVDSIDFQSWVNWNTHPAERAIRHEAYNQYITEEVSPFIRGRVPSDSRFISTGCSMGAYHSTNFFFRHPNIFDVLIAISGIFRLNMFIGDYMDENVYFNSPLAYLPNLTNSWYIDQYRQSKIIVCCGQGAWEGPMLEDTFALKRILDEKNIPCWIDIWGSDVNHDWPWWRKMIPYLLGKLAL